MFSAIEPNSTSRAKHISASADTIQLKGIGRVLVNLGHLHAVNRRQRPQRCDQHRRHPANFPVGISLTGDVEMRNDAGASYPVEGGRVFV